MTRRLLFSALLGATTAALLAACGGGGTAQEEPTGPGGLAAGAPCTIGERCQTGLECIAGVCRLPGTVPCASAFDCPPGNTCTNGICTIQNARVCTSDTMCELGEFCEPSAGICVPLPGEDEEEEEEGEEDDDAGAFLPGGEPCAKDAECQSGVCLENLCSATATPCTVDEHCLNGQACIEGFCRAEIPDAGAAGDAGDAGSGTSGDDDAGTSPPDAGKPSSGHKDAGPPEGSGRVAVLTPGPSGEKGLPFEDGALHLHMGYFQYGQTLEKTLIVRNAGDGELAIDHIGFAAGVSPEFSVVQGVIEGVLLDPGGQVALDLSHTAADATDDEAFVEIAIGGKEPETIRVRVTATMKNEPVANVSPLAYNFGEIQAGKTSETVFTIRNTNPESVLAVQAVEFVSGTPAAFSWEPRPQGTALPQYLNNGGAARIAVIFAPPAEGAFKEDLLVHLNTKDIVKLTVEGEGLAGLITTEPAEIAFGQVEIGQLVTADLKVRNTGSGPVQVTSVALKNGAPFEIIGATGFTLTPIGTLGAVSTVQVRFKPPSKGTYEDTITVIHDGLNSPVTVQLTGEGFKAQTPPLMEIAIVQLDFGSKPVQQTHTKDFTIRNAGEQILQIQNFQFAGSGKDVFSITPKAPVSISPLTTKTFTVSFLPGEGLSYQADLIIFSNDPTKPPSGYFLPLTGKGNAPDVSLSASQIVFAASVGDTLTKDVQIKNNGQVLFTIVSSGLGAVNCQEFTKIAGPPDGFQLAPAETQTFQIQYKPKDLIDDACDFNIKTTVPGQEDVKVQLLGRQKSAIASLTPSILDFGQVALNPTPAPAKSFTIKNDGTEALTISPPAQNGVCGKFTMPNLVSSIPPGSSAVVNAEFAPSDMRAYNCTAAFSTNDPLLQTIKVNMRGVGVAPAMAVTPAGLDFGTRAPGNSGTQNLTVYSTGLLPLTAVMAAASPSCTGVTIADPAPFDLAPGQTKDIGVAQSSSAEGALSGCKVTISADGVPDQFVAVEATASATAPLASLKLGGKPVWNGHAAAFALGSTVSLDALASKAQDGATIATYQWTLVKQPADSTVAPPGQTTAAWSLSLNHPGAYTIKLVVTDSKARASAPVIVKVATPVSVVAQMVHTRRQGEDYRDAGLQFYNFNQSINSDALRCYEDNISPAWGPLGSPLWAGGTVSNTISWDITPYADSPTGKSYRLRADLRNDCIAQTPAEGCVAFAGAEAKVEIKINGGKNGEPQAVCCVHLASTSDYTPYPPEDFVSFTVQDGLVSVIKPEGKAKCFLTPEGGGASAVTQALGEPLCDLDVNGD